MDILLVTAADAGVTSLVVETADLGRLTVPWPCATWHREPIEAWLADDGNSITPWTPPPFDRAAARAGAIAALDALSAAITGRYPAAEVASWPIKDREARAILAGTTDPADTTVVGPLAAALGQDPEDLAAAIVAKANAYTGLMIWIETQRAGLDAALAGPDDAAAEAAVEGLKAAVAGMGAALAD